MSDKDFICIFGVDICSLSTAVVQLTCNEQVVGSNPTESSIKMIQNK